MDQHFYIARPTYLCKLLHLGSSRLLSVHTLHRTRHVYGHRHKPIHVCALCIQPRVCTYVHTSAASKLKAKWDLGVKTYFHLGFHLQGWSDAEATAWPIFRWRWKMDFSRDLSLGYCNVLSGWQGKVRTCLSQSMLCLFKIGMEGMLEDAQSCWEGLIRCCG